VLEGAMTDIWHAIEGFLSQARGVDLLPLAAGLVLHALATVLRGLAWRNILAASAQGRPVASRPIVGGYLAAAGVNALLPARAGDLLKLRIAHATSDDMRYPTLASALVVETVVDAIATVAVIIWAIDAHVIPGAAAVTSLTDSPLVALAAIAIALVGVTVARRFAMFRVRVARGLAIMGTPGSYLRSVALPQLAAMALGLMTTICVLQAFHVPATPGNALRIQAAQLLASALPTGSAGIGIRGAATVYVLAGQATRAVIINYAVASAILLTATSIALGVAGFLLVAEMPGRARHATSSGSASPIVGPNAESIGQLPAMPVPPHDVPARA
jgi:hypothetical protein